MRTVKFLVLPIIISLFLVTCSERREFTNWAYYLGDSATNQYSRLSNIDTMNVHQMSLAWMFSSNDLDTNNRSQIQCNPLIVDGILYGTSAKLKLFALDAATGEKKWTFDPFQGEFQSFGMGVNRGLAYHEDSKGSSRILYSAGRRLYAVNTEDGQLINNFGENGSIDLATGLEEWAEGYFITANSPGIIYKDIIIIGSRVSESIGAAPGHIRAFNVQTGGLEWTFRTIPHPGEEGYESWPEDAYLRVGGANAWSGFSLDQERGIVYCPTGSAAYDFYGGDRHGDNLYANCILALDASSGEKLWHYQVVHHDIWDKDLPAPPNLVDLRLNNETIPALIQITKNGHLFVLNRVTGEPIYEIEERIVPGSLLFGESPSATQPFPAQLPAFSRQNISEADLSDRSEEVASYAHQIFSSTKHEDIYEPPSQEGTIIFPGFDGGGEWGGAAYDEVNQDLIINSNEVPWLCKMESVQNSSIGEGIYKSFCQGCHATDLKGNQAFGNVPSLLGLENRLSVVDFSRTVNQGKGIMPGFTFLNEEQLENLYHFLVNPEDADELEDQSFWPYPYQMRGYEKLYAQDGYPIISPPWGQLTSVNIEKAIINWQIPLGHYEELNSVYDTNTGTENYGGPVVTAGGLIFIAATADEKIRAFHARTGDELWNYELPAAGYATPSLYSINGKQFVVIACGGGKLGSNSGDFYMAFSL